LPRPGARRQEEAVLRKRQIHRAAQEEGNLAKATDFKILSAWEQVLLSWWCKSWAEEVEQR
jgi:hypothetical protein